MSMNGGPMASDQPTKPIPMSWRWWVFPIFWALVFCTGLALSTLALYNRHPEQLNGWSGIGLGVMLLANFGIFMLLAWGWLYRAWPLPAWRGLIIFGVQIVLLLLMMRWYGPSFAWISLALLYPVIGGLPKRQWPLPVALLLLIFGAGTLLPDSTAGVSTASLLNAGLQIAVNLGIAVGLRLLSAQSERLRIALEQLRQAHAELAASAAQKEELAVLRERTRLARAMHDNLGHALVVMNVKLEAAQLLYARDPARGDAELDATRVLIRTAMAELRHALGDLRAPAAERGDLATALQRLVHETHARTNIEITCDIAPDLPELPAEAGEAIWYVAREALTNAEKHAGAARMSVTLEQTPDGLLLRVADDGAGILPDDLRRPEHYGVVGMRERMNGLGGTLRIQRGAAGGTVVEAQIPLEFRVQNAELSI